MWISTAVIAATVWFGCGIYAVILDLREYPEPVSPGLDESFRVFMVFAGPAYLAAFLLLHGRPPHDG